MTKGKTMTRMRFAPNIIRLFHVLASAALITLAAGCTDIVPGTVRAGPNLKPRPLTGEVIKDTMLTDTELSHVFGQSFVIDRTLAFGGPCRAVLGLAGFQTKRLRRAHPHPDG